MARKGGPPGWQRSLGGPRASAAGESFDRTLHTVVREPERLAGMVLDDGYPKFDRGPGIPSEEHWADSEPMTLVSQLDDDPG